MAKGTGYKQFNSQDREVVQLQKNVEAALSGLIVGSVLDSILLTNLSLSSGDNIITHKLGRKIIGYIPVSVSAATAFYDKIYTTDTDLEHEFTLNSSAACVVVLLVF